MNLLQTCTMYRVQILYATPHCHNQFRRFNAYPKFRCGLYTAFGGPRQRLQVKMILISYTISLLHEKCVDATNVCSATRIQFGRRKNQRIWQIINQSYAEKIIITWRKSTWVQTQRQWGAKLKEMHWIHPLQWRFLISHIGSAHKMPTNQS